MGGRKFTFDSNHDGPPTYDILTFSKDRVVGKTDYLLDGWEKVGSFVDNSKYIFYAYSLITQSQKSKACIKLQGMAQPIPQALGLIREMVLTKSSWLPTYYLG